MTPEQARARILGGITRSRHVEPFTWAGTTYGARVPNQLQLHAADALAAKIGAPGRAAMLAIQCTEIAGALVFKPEDLQALLQDEPHGFLEAFWTAIRPFLLAPIMPRAMQEIGARR